MRPLAVLSHVLPPSPSGQAVVLYRLLRDWDLADYRLLSRQNYDAYACGQNSPSRLPARYYHLAAGFRLRGASRLGVLAVVNGLLEILQRARNVVRIVKREKCGAILACSGDIIDLPAGYLASRWARVPFYAYIFDYYSYQWTRPAYRFFARCAEPIVLKGAAGVIVPNEFLRDEYRRRYQVEPTVIHNPCEVAQIDKEHDFPWPAEPGKVKIVFTGAIYHANYDAFRNLIAAIEQLGRTDVKLHLYTAQPLPELERENICGPIVYHNHRALSKVFEVQRQADILFLPLAFESAIPEVIRTSAPGKMGEYLASGRPILVHAPADSFVSWYFKTHECGVVVDQSDPRMLVQAIQRILDDAELRRKLRRNARSSAQIDFGLDGARTKFLRVFQPKGGS